MLSKQHNKSHWGDRYIPTANLTQKNGYVNFDEGEEKDIRYRQLLLGSIQDPAQQKLLTYASKRKNETHLASQNQMLENHNKLPIQKAPAQRQVLFFYKWAKINSAPEKILDAPDIVDDFYLNILDWGINNQLAIGLSNSLYIWNAYNGHIEELMGDTLHQDSQSLITAVHWMNSDILSVGFDNGLIKLIDINNQKVINRLSYHNQRVNAINSTWDLLSSSGRDQSIINHDPRERNQNIISIFEKHTQEVCGLKWQSQTQTLASGANDNMVLLWDKRQMKLRLNCEGHCAAVKALSWCPWQPNGLATGGGSNDRSIRFWNTDSGQCTKVIETGSQVCAIQFLPRYKEMISSHGFSRYQITLWKAENLFKTPQKLQELQGHQSRVLHLGLSPDQSLLCSAAGDETLRFWRVGQDVKQEDSPTKGIIDTMKNQNLR